MGAAGEGFGQRIRQARLNLSAKLGRVVTQTEVAEKVGVTGTTVGRWESGEKEPSLDTFVRLAAVLRVRASYLAFGEEAVAPLEPPSKPLTDEDYERAAKQGKRQA